MKTKSLRAMALAIMALLSSASYADSSVTLSASNKTLAGTNDFAVTLKSPAYLSSNRIKLPKGSTSSFTVTYRHSNAVITKIVFGWYKTPTKGTISANYGTYSYATTWTAPSGGLKSVRFSSNGASESQLSQMTIYYKTTDGSSSSTGSGSSSDTGSSTGTGTSTGTGSSTGTGTSTGSTSTTVSGLSAYDKNAPIGWATVGGTTTGSSNKNAVTVTTKSALLSALSGTGQKTIYVKGTINFTGMETVKDAANKTVYGLPGSALVNSIHSSTVSQSGILSFNRCKNIILRNLTFKSAGAYDIDGNDNLQFQNSDYIWVDHCDFQDGVDGNFDCNNGTDHIAVTWCRFRYLISPWAGGSGGSNQHCFSDLWGGSDSNSKDPGHLNTTFANCWWDEGCIERMPRVRFGQVHILNCLYSSSKANYCVGAAYRSNLYVEKCAFTSSATQKTPWKCYATKSGYTDYNITLTGNQGASDVQKKSGSYSYFIPSNKYSYSSMSASQVQTEVKNHAGATLKISEGGTVGAKSSTFFDEETTGIETVNGTSEEVVSEEIYSLNGARISSLQKGINIVKTRYADGSVKTKKVVRR